MRKFRGKPIGANRPRYGGGDSRSILIGDETEDGYGELYKCWFCGFSGCRTERDSRGGENTPNNITYQDFQVNAVSDEGTFAGYINGGYQAGGINSVTPMLGDAVFIQHRIPVVRAGNDTNPGTVVHNFSMTPSGGCPFCGSKNYDGHV